MQHYAQQYLSEEKVALTHLGEPLFAALAGAVLLHEALTPRTGLGGLLIFGAMVLAEVKLRGQARRPKPAKAPVPPIQNSTLTSLP
ncbi:hypothetical protein GCM10011378_39170 [Hymenobacter glacieicola]|uniref:EamA domain-containing protein n=1 Tax=Hymenobacter glacieicola TaxID=1562124 RepID=A0ABQ1X7L8_9BACT|nr:hypothetical protein GCM10011378_39170 [Hymenobacter glacieicola]